MSRLDELQKRARAERKLAAQNAMKVAKGHATNAAKLLGIGRATLYRWLKL